MAVAVRYATSAELESALGVWKSANDARGLPPSLERIERVREKLADPNAVVLVAIDEVELIGMVLAEPGRSDDGGSLVPDLGHISMVFIRPDRQGQGVGSDLLGGLVHIAGELGWSRLSLWTRRSNASARGLYVKQGFSLTGEAKRLAGGDSIDRWQRVL